MSLIQLFEFASMGALAVQTWETLVYFSDEVEYLWTGRFNVIKGLYIASRYGMLMAQILNQALSYVEGTTLHANTCAGISVYRAIVGQLGMILVEVIMLIRVYALYNQSYRMKYILVGSFITAALLETTGSVILVRSLFPMVAPCQPPKASRKGLFLVGTGAGFCQCIIFITTSYKFVTRRSSGWARTPLTSLILREGVVMFILVLALIIVLVVHEVVRNLNLSVEIAVFSWYIAFISIGASRLILNIRKVAIDQRQLRSTRQNEGTRNVSSALYELDDSIFLDSFHE